MNKQQQSEGGQALVLIVLAIVGILGFTALAVDGGHFYAERRSAQNAADSAAMSAAYAAATKQTSAKVQQAAFSKAAINGYVNDPAEASLAENERKTVVKYENPPTSGPYAGNKEYYRVLITTEIEPYFSDIVYGGQSRQTVEAVARARAADNFANGHVIHATSVSGSAVLFKGNIDVHVHGGNIYSSANGGKSGSSGKVKVHDGDILLVGSWSGDKTGVSPNPKTGQSPVSAPALPVPDCNFPNGKEIKDKKGTNILTPGRHSNIKINGGDWVMEPGMYCIEGGLTVNGNATLTGNGAMIVMLSGGMKLNGGGQVIWTRPSSVKDASGAEWGGMMIYVPKSNTNEVYLTGGNDTAFSGTIYAPGSQCELGGNADAMAFNANMICNNFVFHGNPYMDITYISEQNFRLPPSVELVQ
jgi:hypothetical protein